MRIIRNSWVHLKNILLVMFKNIALSPTLKQNVVKVQLQHHSMYLGVHCAGSAFMITEKYLSVENGASLQIHMLLMHDRYYIHWIKGKKIFQEGNIHFIENKM